MHEPRSLKSAQRGSVHEVDGRYLSLCAWRALESEWESRRQVGRYLGGAAPERAELMEVAQSLDVSPLLMSWSGGGWQRRCR